MNMIIRLLITAGSAFCLAKYLNIGVRIEDFTSALVFAVVLGILNAILKPVLSFIGLPLTVLTLGLFSLVINAVVIMLAAYFVKGMEVEGFWWAMLFSIVLSFITSVVSQLTNVFFSSNN